jgi:nucleotide-binding universal stress UspA family protein
MPIRLQKILVPTDFSPAAAAAVKYACELATRFDAELHLLHALEVHPSLTPEFGMGLVLPKFISESKAAAEKLLAAALDPRWATDRTVVRSVVEGSPKAEIVRYRSASRHPGKRRRKCRADRSLSGADREA